MPKPKLILDTNVAQTLLQPNYQADLNRIVGRISSRFQVVVSPQTYLELLNSVCGGDEAHFEDHRNRLRLTVGRGNPEFLPFPVAVAVFKEVGRAAGRGRGEKREVGGCAKKKIR